MLTAVCAVIVVLCAGLMPDPYAAVACSAVAVALFLSAIFLGLRNNVVKCAAFSIAFVVAISCFLITIITRHNWTNELSDSSEHYISGTIVSRKLTDSGARYVLDDVTADGDEIKGKVSIVATDDDSATVAFLKCGDRVGITASVTFKKLTTKNRYAISDNVRYFINANASDLEFYKSTSGFFFKLRNEMSDALDKNLGDYGQIALGMLTGDKGGVDDDVIDYYSVSGIGHILSVSGLHVGFVVALMSFILDKLRANRTVKLVAIACALIFYCFLASFALSVVRASIMCVLGLLAGTLGKQRDPLSGLCFAVTAILAVKPLSLFDVGFLMSVSAVLGILLFSKSFNRVFFALFAEEYFLGAVCFACRANRYNARFIGFLQYVSDLFGAYKPDSCTDCDDCFYRACRYRDDNADYSGSRHSFVDCRYSARARRRYSKARV